MAKAYTKPSPTRSAIGKRLIRFRKPSCEHCGTSERLGVHHKDRNWRNNDISNLMTLCSSCHTSLHHTQGDLARKRTQPLCLVCGKQSYRPGLCHKHRTRQRRYGNPWMTKIMIGKSWQLVSEQPGMNGLPQQESATGYQIDHTALDASEIQ